MFNDRTDAGRRLGAALADLDDRDVVVLGLPRGGVPVAAEVAEALHAPLDVLVVRKLGLPEQPELAMGAIGEGGARVLNENVLRMTGVSRETLEEVELRERLELAERAKRFRGSRPPVDLTGMIAVIVDDGVATGATARAACEIARERGAERVVLAVPVGARDTLALLRRVADEVVCLETPDAFFAVGQAYDDFRQVTDDEVVARLASEDPPRTASGDVTVTLENVRLPGYLSMPDRPRGLVLFAHGSGSSRHSPRNKYVAEVLNDAGLATFLFDLLTSEEARDRSNVFDIDLLGRRLADTTVWLRRRDDLSTLALGYFGASTGAAAALTASLDPRVTTAAVVSRGGRPDLVGERLREVKTPTLLIVGGNDYGVLDLNRDALELIPSDSELRVVPGATHLFEEPGALERAAGLACDWFLRHLD